MYILYNNNDRSTYTYIHACIDTNFNSQKVETPDQSIQINK